MPEGNRDNRGIKAAAGRIRRDLRDYRTGILVFAVYYITVHVVFHAFCPVVLFTGLPCAGCGMTRAFLFLFTGQWERSWRMNPMAIFVLLFLFYCVVMRYVFGKKIKGLKSGTAVLCLCLLAVYGYRMTVLFPNRPPYVYTPGNFLEKTVPFYKEILRRVLGI